MGVYSTTTATAYADKIKAVYEYLDEIRKVADRLTPVEDLTSFQAQIEALYAQLDLLVEASGVIVTATPTGEAILTGTVASIKTLLEIYEIPLDVVRRVELEAALALLDAQLTDQMTLLNGQVNTLDLSLDNWTQFVQAQQTQIDGLQITSNNLVTGQDTAQSNLTTTLSRLTIQEEHAIAVDLRLDTIDQSVTSVITGLQSTNSTVSGHTATIETLYGITSLHTSSIDQLGSELVNANTGITANTTALNLMETTITGLGNDLTAQSSQTTALKSIIGGSGNLLPNADFGASASGWSIVVAEEDWASSILTTDTFNMPAEVHCLEVLGTPTPLGQIVVESPTMLVEAGRYYMVSGYPCVDNGQVAFSYKAFNNAEEVVDQGTCPPTFNATTNANFSSYTRTWVKFMAPIGATKLRLYLTATGDGDFITQAALFRPMVEQSWVEQTEPSAWTPNVTGVMEGLEGSLNIVEAALINEMITSANKNAAVAASLNTLTARMVDVETSNAGSVNIVQGIDARVTNTEAGIAAQGTALTSLESTVNDPVTGLVATSGAVGSLTTRVTSAEGVNTAQGNAITSLESSVNNPSTGVAANATAIGTLATRVTSAEGSITSQASSITSLQSTVNNATTGVAASATAISTLQTRATSIEGVNTSQAASITSLSTTVSGHTASISSQLTSINGLKTKWSVTSDVNGYITGLENSNDGTVTEFNIRADKFKLTPSGGGARTEFSGGNWRVYDAAGVLRVAIGVGI